MKIVDLLLQGRAVHDSDPNGLDHYRKHDGAVAACQFVGLPVIDVTDVREESKSSLITDFTGMRLRPPFEECLLTAKMFQVEVAVWIRCHQEDDDTLAMWLLPYWLQRDGKPHVGRSWRVAMTKTGTIEAERPYMATQLTGCSFPEVLGYETPEPIAARDLYPWAIFHSPSRDGKLWCADFLAHDEAWSAFDDSFRLIMFSLALLNCKNVSTVEQPCSPKLAKRYQERHGHKRNRYYVLDIEPMKQVFKRDSGGEPVTLAKALHICRGHFKNFDAKPLFGKLKGTYWWQPHVRGTAEAGIVEKDYRIKFPDDKNGYRR